MRYSIFAHPNLFASKHYPAISIPFITQSARDPACRSAVGAAVSRKRVKRAANFIGIKPDP